MALLQCGSIHVFSKMHLVRMLCQIFFAAVQLFTSVDAFVSSQITLLGEWLITFCPDEQLLSRVDQFVSF